MPQKFSVVDEESYIFWQQLFGSANCLPNSILINFYFQNVLKSMIKRQKEFNSPIDEFFERRNIKMVKVILKQGMADRVYFEEIDIISILKKELSKS